MTNTNVINERDQLPATLEIGQFNVIGSNVKIGENVRIGNNCTIESGVIIGDRTVIRSNVELRANTVVGADCYIDSGVKSSGDNVIGNGVTLRFDCIVARGCDIGDRSYICPQVMTNNLNHKQEPVGGAEIGEDCFIGTQVVLAAGIEITSNTTVGSCSMVTKSLSEAGVYIGIPARLGTK